MIAGADGAPLSVGRKTRSIAGAIKRALLRRDETCRFPGCTNRLFLEGHHIRHWADGGETKLENLALVCSHHHRFVHEYGYRVALESGECSFFDPRGRRVEPKPASRTTDLGWPAIREANGELGIGAQTLACEWDGSQVDYGVMVGALVRADHLS